MNKLIWDEQTKVDFVNFAMSKHHRTPVAEVVAEFLISKQQYKDFEILERYNYGEIPCDGDIAPIKKVKRLPDGKIFSIGDVCKDDDGIYTYKPIKKFFISEDVMYAQFDEGHGCNDGCLGINGLKKVGKPILTTEDGKEVFEGGIFWFIDNYFDLHSDTAIPNTQPSKLLKYFSTKEVAKEYILQNKQLLSIKDLKDIHSKKRCFGDSLISFAQELVKERLSNVK